MKKLSKTYPSKSNPAICSFVSNPTAFRTAHHRWYSPPISVECLCCLRPGKIFFSLQTEGTGTDEVWSPTVPTAVEVADLGVCCSCTLVAAFIVEKFPFSCWKLRDLLIESAACWWIEATEFDLGIGTPSILNLGLLKHLGLLRLTFSAFLLLLIGCPKSWWEAYTVVNFTHFVEIIRYDGQ